MCLLHLSAVRSDHADKPLWSTSELTVCLQVHRFASGLKRGTGRDHSYKRHATHKRRCGVRASLPILRFVSIAFYQAPYASASASPGSRVRAACAQWRAAVASGSARPKRPRE